MWFIIHKPPTSCKFYFGQQSFVKHVWLFYYNHLVSIDLKDEIQN